MTVDATPADASSADTISPDTQSICQARHLVCGSAGTEQCGVCPFASTCLPEQTGCLGNERITGTLALGTAVRMLDLGDRMAVQTAANFGTAQPYIAVIFDSGTQVVLDSADDVLAIAQSSTTAFWSHFDGRVHETLRNSPLVGALPTPDGKCRGLAATDDEVLCGLENENDASKNGVYRLFGGGWTRIATALIGSMEAQGDRLYFFDAGSLKGLSLSTLAPLPIASNIPYGSILAVTVDGVLVRAADPIQPAQQNIWWMSADGKTARLLSVLNNYTVIGVAPDAIIISSQSLYQSIGILPFTAIKSGMTSVDSIETLIQRSEFDMERAVKRGNDYLFIGRFAGTPLLITLTR